MTTECGTEIPGFSPLIPFFERRLMGNYFLFARFNIPESKDAQSFPITDLLDGMPVRRTQMVAESIQPEVAGVGSKEE
jgi:hypothetical protein